MLADTVVNTGHDHGNFSLLAC